MSNAQAHNAKDLNFVVAMYNLIENRNNSLKTSESLWQYYRGELHVNVVNSESFKSKMRITGIVPAADNTKDVEIAVLLKYLRVIFGRLLKCL